MSVIETIIARIRELQNELEAELAKRGEALRYRLENGRVVFERDTLQRHRRLRVGLADFLKRTRPLVVLTAPVIYALIVPFVLLDLSVWIYQTICFPVYGIPKVPRREHIRIDRHKLAYLNGLQKLNCVYCGYGNGVIAYAREVAGRTEAYWCPIKHAGGVSDPHPHYAEFIDFGDAEGFVENSEHLREKMKRDA
ncbi:hypothetical protein LZG00_04560 [Rhodobacteraceae bacterium LMO-12]|nr:hypothetical protein [Rhodobacteraceae bacterium LMO-JJ12]